MKIQNKICTSQQTNYIGYSFGSLLASHTAIHYADLGHTIDNLVLIDSPISKDFLLKLQKYKKCHHKGFNIMDIQYMQVCLRWIWN